MCRPFDKEGKYFYPARVQVCIAYASISLLMVPYWLNPMSNAVMLAAQIAGIIFYPLAFTLLFHRYFRGQDTKPAWIRMTLHAVPTLTILAVVICASAIPQAILSVKNELMFIAGLMSLILTFQLVKMLNWIRIKIEDYHRQNFSNEDDFPYRFAEKIIFLPTIVIMEWGIFLSGSRDLKAIFDILFAIAMVAFLCIILHPQKALRPESAKKEIELMRNEEEQCLSEQIDEFEEENEDDLSYSTIIDEDAKKRVLEIIGRRFKEPHLQKKEVLAEIERGKVHQANLYIRSKGYYTLISMFRLEFARQYSLANPNLKQSAIAQAAGFTSGSSFSKAKKSIDHIDPEVVETVHI